MNAGKIRPPGKTGEYQWQKYRRLPGNFWAMRMNVDFECKTLQGTLQGHAGDWLVRGDGGQEFPVPDSLFRRQYTER